MASRPFLENQITLKMDQKCKLIERKLIFFKYFYLKYLLLNLYYHAYSEKQVIIDFDGNPGHLLTYNHPLLGQKKVVKISQTFENIMSNWLLLNL